MNAGEIIAIIAICTAVIGGFLGNIFWMLMVEELYSRNQDSNFDRFAGRVNMGRWAEYRKACPNGKLHIYAGVGFALALVSVIVLVSLGLARLAVSRLHL